MLWKYSFVLLYCWALLFLPCFWLQAEIHADTITHVYGSTKFTLNYDEEYGVYYLEGKATFRKYYHVRRESVQYLTSPDRVEFTYEGGHMVLIGGCIIYEQEDIR